MKKWKQLMIRLFSMILISFIFAPETVAAASGSLEIVDTEATIQNDGTIDIRQKWLYDDRDVGGTEHYLNMNGGYSLDGEMNTMDTMYSDFQVSRNGIPMTFVEYWHIDNSFDEKIDKYGIIDLGDAIELSFGISEYVENEYLVEYTIHNAVKETTDGHKYVHWAFVPTDLSPAPEALLATIGLGDDSLFFDKIYGFNYEGFVEFTDDELKDKVQAEMTGSYTDDTMLNLFVLINDDENRIENTLVQDFTLEDKVSEMFVGSDYDIEDFSSEQTGRTDSVKEKFGIRTIIFGLLGVIFWIFGLLLRFMPFIIMGVVFLVPLYMKSQEESKLLAKMSKDDIKMIKKDKDFYRRDEPQVEMEFYPILDIILNFSKSEENVVMYFVSKWTEEGVFEYIREIQPEKSGMFKSKKPSIEFVLHEDQLNSDAPVVEIELFKLFDALTDNQGRLDTNDLSKLSPNRIQQILKAHKSAYRQDLMDRKLMEKNGRNVELTHSGIRTLENHIGLKNYLTDYTLINEREASEIQLWDFYFRLAALYGVTEAFKSQLDKLPNLDVESQAKYNQYYGTTGSARMNYLIASNVSRNMERQRAKQAQAARSSGSGGSSSMGGGGGFSGGGSGGGTR